MITTLSQLIAQVESSGNPFAVRFEPHYSCNVESALKMQKLAACNFDTADVLCACSWGLFQIMGDNLIALGLKTSPIEYCGDKIAQLDMFNAYCVQNRCNYSLDEIITDAGKRIDFARKYNGPGAVNSYAQALLNTYRDFSNA